MKRELDHNLFGNEVYRTNSLILLVKNMLCNKLHCQKGSNVNLLSCKIKTLSRFGETVAGEATSNPPVRP